MTLTSPENARIKRRMRELRLRYGNFCWACGARVENLEFAHLKDTELTGHSKGRGRKERYYDILRNAECYGLLCRSCHIDFDGKTLAADKATQLSKNWEMFRFVLSQPFNPPHFRPFEKDLEVASEK